MLMREQMHDYQRKAVAKILSTPKCALWLDMGLGKTVSTLTALSDMLESFEIGRVLIIAPLRVCNTVWMQEAQKWEHLQGLTFAIATGSQQQRQDAIASGADITIPQKSKRGYAREFGPFGSAKAAVQAIVSLQ